MRYLLILISAALCSCSLTHTLSKKSVYAGAAFAQKKAIQKPLQTDTTTQPFRFVDKRGDTLTVLSNKDFTKDENGEQMRMLTANSVNVVARSRVVAERMGKVNLDFVVSMPKDMQNRCYAVMITPTLHRGAVKEQLEDLAVRGELLSQVQERDHWQASQYRNTLTKLSLFDTVRIARKSDDFIRYPYPQGVRLDSVVRTKEAIAYHYTQEVPIVGENIKKMLVTLGGRVVALDGSSYRLPSVDTLVYNISSMLAFVYTTSRYVTKVVDKYATVQDRNYLTFKVGNTSIIDTMGSNADQLEKMKVLMKNVLTQEEFIVDSVVLTASSSPEGLYAQNAKLSAARARSLADYLRSEVDPYNDYGIDTLITVRSIAEDWAELRRQLIGDNAEAIREMIDKARDYDALELAIRKRFPEDYKQIRQTIYPKLRSVTFRYALRRKGMVKDTIHTTELDTVYARGVEYLKARDYSKAAYYLNDYRDQNSAVTLLSRGYDDEAYKILVTLPPTAVNRYLLAIVCTRLRKYQEGRRYYEQSCEIDENMEYRGNLDPEITELLKHQNK